MQTSSQPASRLACGSSELRALFPHTAQRKIYIDHASIGPLSLRVRGAIEGHLANRSEGDINTYFRDIELAKECRSLAARLVNAESAERIAFVMNTSDALNIVPAGISWQHGDRILLNDQEFPSNVYPYLNLRRFGVEIEMLTTRNGEVTPEMVENALKQSGGRIKLVSLSAVQFLSGYRADLAAIGALCKKYDAIFVVDAIQAAGAIPLDVQAMQIDALATGAQKWLMATTGIAFLYLTEELQERIEQAHLGWLSVAKPWDFFHYDQPLQSSAMRYENGTVNFPGIIGLGASLKTLLEVSPEATERHLTELTQYFLAELPSLGIFSQISGFAAEHRAGIVSGRLLDEAQGEILMKRLAERSVTVSLREGRLRFSPHCYNTTEEMREVVAALREAVG
ncbi:MAG: aminotransferase class V-fold PLP-dependent enzyme [Candidatus Kapabacteria bacterium]|jgi:selenocysteine lyase/cysteine desulfurase|nr:aminotransferase class V-fold PLP-dependent enzyme [Candidatus Kapabacteria bacterium]